MSQDSKSDKVKNGRNGDEALLRTDIERLLETEDQRRLTLVQAPPGYGKTILLTRWKAGLETIGRTTLSFTFVRDDDVVALSRGLARAAKLSGLGVIEPAHDAEADLPELLRRLPDGATVFIDGFNHQTGPAVSSMLTRLVEDREHKVSIVLAANCEPDMPLATLEAYGLLTRVGTAELALDQARTHLFLNRLIQGEASLALSRELHEYTEGWPVGLNLVASAGPFQTGEALHLSAKIYRRIDRFFQENVFARLTDDQRALVIELAPLQSWDSALCEQLLGDRYQPDLLETLIRCQCFVLEAADGAPRPHRMFSDFLFRRRPKAAALVAHKNAASVLAKAGSLAGAVDQALAADEMGSAIEWAEACALEVFNRGEHKRVRLWLDAIPAKDIEKRPKLCLAAGLTYYSSREPQKALQFLAAGARVLRSDRNEPDPDLLHQITLLQTFYPIVCDDSEAGRQALVAPDSALTDADVAAGQLVRAWCVLYDTGASSAEALLQDAVEEPPFQSLTVELHRLHLKGLVARLTGELHRSQSIFMEMHKLAMSLQPADSPLVALAAAGAAPLAYEWGHVAEVEASVPEYLSGLQNCGSIEGLMGGYSALIRSQSALGKTKDAWATLAQVEDLAAGRNVRRLLTFCEAERAMLYVAQGELSRAMKCAADLVAGVEAKSSDRGSANAAGRLIALRTAAAVHVAAGDSQSAMPVLLSVADELGRLGFLYELAAVQALLSVAYHHLGQRQEARQYAAEALAIGEPSGMLRSFADCGPAFATVLRDLRSALGQRPLRKISPKYLGMVIDYLSSAAALPEPVSVKSIMRCAPLSSREAEIARLVYNGLSNKEVGRALHLSNETVKWHLSKIYQKLHVSGRAEAVQSILKLIRDPNVGLAAVSTLGNA